MPTARQVILIILVFACLGASAAMLPQIDFNRKGLAGLTPVGSGPAQPEIVLLRNVLGGFRGLLVNVVWLRAVKLQQAEKYWELYQLYDWMGKLEPHMEEIWVFNGWNMSYNLVAELPDSEARWQWIMRAVEWLRDQGLKYNPRSGKIMKEISWIFFHKIGRNLDIHNFYYKHRWALIMHGILGSREMQDFPCIRDADERYKSLADLLADPDVAKALSGFSLDPPEEAIAALDEAEGLYGIPEAVGRVLVKTENKDAWRKVRTYIAARVLREVYKMNRFDVMAQMEEQFGKFDWRLPEPHAIYWSVLASETSLTLKSQIQYDRIILFSLQETMRRGIIAYLGPNPSEPMVTTFDLSKVAPLNAHYELMMMKYDYWDRDDPGAKSIIDGHVQFLEEVSFDLYFAGYTKEARKYYMLRKKIYDKPLPFIPLDQFMLGRVKKLVDEFGTQAKVRAFVDSLINRTCFYLAMNRPDEARKYEKLARDGWNVYAEYDEAQEQDRTKYERRLPYWKEVLRENIRMILAGKSRSFPRDLVPSLRRVLGVKEGTTMEKLDFGAAIAPQIVPSSPPPK